jgi:predicted Zn-dependent protease
MRFGATALILISGTLVLVLVVLPERYVLRPGFRESGLSFPDPTVPFEPLPVRTVAARLLPEPPTIQLAGPSEAFWQAVTPVLDVGRYADALPVFDRYLLDHPGDADVRRELVVTLVAANRPAEAIAELRRLTELADDPGTRLLLARMLRDQGWTDEAAAEYARLAASRPNDVVLALEHAQTYAWAQRYGDAARVLGAALARHPEAAHVRVELARVYFALARVEEARALLEALDERALADASGTELRDAVAAALYVPPPPPPPPSVPPTLLEQAVAAREADDFVRARALFDAALRELPTDPAVWRAYADLLEYELGDFGSSAESVGEFGFG